MNQSLRPRDNHNLAAVDPRKATLAQAEPLIFITTAATHPAHSVGLSIAMFAYEYRLLRLALGAMKNKYLGDTYPISLVEADQSG